MAIPVPNLNPIENEWSGLKRSANMDLGICIWRNEWSLISGQVFSSSGIIGEESELVSWHKEVAKSI